MANITKKHLRKNKMKINFLGILFLGVICLLPNNGVAQSKDSDSTLIRPIVSIPVKKHEAPRHFIGASGGYSINNMSSSVYEDLRSTGNWVNYGVIYKYYNPKWVGLQTGINYTERGYQRDSTSKRIYQTLELPFVSQFHVEVWKFRIMANAGLFVAYSLSAEDTYLYPPEEEGKKEKYTFQSTDNRFDYGLRFGAGLGLMLYPVEVQFEFNYALGLGYVHEPLIPNQTTIYNRLSQMIFSVGVLIAL